MRTSYNCWLLLLVIPRSRLPASPRIRRGYVISIKAKGSVAVSSGGSGSLLVVLVHFTQRARGRSEQLRLSIGDPPCEGEKVALRQYI